MCISCLFNLVEVLEVVNVCLLWFSKGKYVMWILITAYNSYHFGLIFVFMSSNELYSELLLFG